MLANVLLGITLGFAAGISPGPMLALVITRSLEKGFGSGLRVAIAPLFSDLPIVLGSVLLATTLPAWTLHALAIAGGVFLVFLGIEQIIRARRASLAQPGGQRAAEDLTQAVLVNLLNPHPWLFWFTVGGPIVVGAWALSPWNGTSFLASFYLLLVGSKILLAWLIAKGRNWLSSRRYQMVLQACGVMLVIVGILLVWRP